MATRTKTAVDPRTEIQKLLRKGKTTWKESREEAKNLGPIDVPDGVYEVDFDSAEFKVKDGTPYIVRRHVIVDGDHADKILPDTLWFDLDNPKRTAYIYAWIELLGYDLPEDPAELYDLVEQITADGYSGVCKVYHWGDNARMGIDLQKVYEAEEGAEGTEEPATEEGTEEPPLEDMSIDELLQICEEDGIQVPKGRRGRKPAKAAIIKAIEDFDAAQEAEEGTEEPATEEGDDDDAQLLEDTAEFCKAQDIKLTKGDATDLEAMKKKISKYDYVRTELEEEDVELLNEIGLGELVVEEEPAEEPAEEPPATTKTSRGRGRGRGRSK
jgi:hypothetical protein